MTGSLDRSLIFDTWRALNRLLGDVSWPDPPTGTGKVVPALGAFDQNGKPAEWVLLRLNIDNATQTWATNRRTKDEEFVTDIVVGSNLKFRTALAAIDRLEELTAPIERMLLVTASGPQQPAEMVGRLTWWVLDGMEPAMYVLDTGGFGVQARLPVRVKARIGGMPS